MLSNKKILICGAGGLSGQAAVKLCLSLNCFVYISDGRGDRPLPDFLGDYEGSYEDMRPREDVGLLDDCRPDFIITAPGVPLKNEIFKRARKEKIPVYGEHDFAFRIMQEQWVEPPFAFGITGTDGKSTTTALLAHLINETVDFEALPCGNFGKPLSDLVLELSPTRTNVVLVAECSSFQLEPLTFFKPDVSMILNVAGDHQDRYAGPEDYLKAKLKISHLQTEMDLLLAPESILKRARELIPKELRFRREREIPVGEEKDTWIEFQGKRLVSFEEITLPGRHNRLNLRFALAAYEDFVARKKLTPDLEKLKQAILSFRGLPHRMEQVGSKGKLHFVNDSKATTIQAVLTAIKAYREDRDYRVYLLCGGRDKGADFTLLPGPDGSLHVLPFGEAARKICNVFKISERYADLPLAFAEAVAQAEAAAKDDPRPAVVLLSPGCASYDAYGSYMERGEHYIKLVKECLN